MNGLKHFIATTNLTAKSTPGAVGFLLALGVPGIIHLLFAVGIFPLHLTADLASLDFHCLGRATRLILPFDSI